MELLDPPLFYTGLVASMYAEMRSVDPDPEPYARFVEAKGQPALELGCGDGDPLIELRRRGLEVEGLDSSPDMLERCRRRAAEQGLDVVLHQQRMEALALPRRYRTMFLAGPTFNLLPDDDLARRALEGMLAHLEPGGWAMVPLFVPPVTAPARLGVARERVVGDGSTLRVTATGEERDETRRVQTTVLRYEMTSPAGTSVTERPWTLHWHTQDGFRDLAEGAGFEVVGVLDGKGRPAAAADDHVAFVLTSPATADPG